MAITKHTLLVVKRTFTSKLSTLVDVPIGIGEAVARSPLPPDMWVRIGRFRGLRKAIGQPRKTERVEVGAWKRDGQGRAVRHTPGAVRTTRRLCGEFLINPALA
jgi:hypothetical protein